MFNSIYVFFVSFFARFDTFFINIIHIYSSSLKYHAKYVEDERTGSQLVSQMWNIMFKKLEKILEYI